MSDIVHVSEVSSRRVVQARPSKTWTCSSDATRFAPRCPLTRPGRSVLAKTRHHRRSALHRSFASRRPSLARARAFPRRRFRSTGWSLHFSQWHRSTEPRASRRRHSTLPLAGEGRQGWRFLQTCAPGVTSPSRSRAWRIHAAAAPAPSLRWPR